MPCLRRLDCNFIHSVAPLLDALAAPAAIACSEYGLIGVRVCPYLHHIHLWYCDGVQSATLVRLIKLRNGFASENDITTSRNDPGEKRPIKPLPKGAHLPTASAISWKYMGNNKEQGIEKAEQVSIELCRPMFGEEARALKQWGVEVQCAAEPRPADNAYYDLNI